MRFKVYSILMLVALTARAFSGLYPPPKPNPLKPKQYTSWYKAQVKATVPKNETVLLLRETVLPDCADIDELVGSITAKNPVWKKTENKEASKCIHQVNSSLERVTLLEKMNGLLSSTHQHLANINLPHIKNDALAVKVLVCTPFEDKFDEELYIACINEAVKIVFYGQYNNFSIVEKRWYYDLKDIVYCCVINVLNRQFVSEAGKKALLEVFKKYEDQSLAKQLISNTYFEEAFTYNQIQEMRVLIADKFDRDKTTDWLSTYGYPNSESIYPDISKERPSAAVHIVDAYFEEMRQIINQDSKAVFEEMDKCRSKHIGANGFLKYFPLSNFQEVYMKASVLDTKRLFILSQLN